MRNTETDNQQDIIDSRDVIQRIDELDSDRDDAIESAVDEWEDNDDEDKGSNVFYASMTGPPFNRLASNSGRLYWRLNPKPLSASKLRQN